MIAALSYQVNIDSPRHVSIYDTDKMGCFGLYFSLFPPYREAGGGARATNK